MKVWPPLSFFFLASLWLTASPVTANEDLLEADDTLTILNEILVHHVEQRELTPQLIDRSLKLYADQFDLDKVYLVEEELEPFTEPSKGRVSQIQSQLDRGNLSQYYSLNRLIQEAIHRNREIRAELAEDFEALLAEAVDYESEDRDPELPYAKSEEELTERIRKEIIGFTAYQVELLGEEIVGEKGEQVIQLYERNLRTEENKYLFVDDDGRKLSKDWQEHFMVLHTLKSLAKSLDSHTAFFSYNEAYDMRVRLEKGFEGVGIVLQEGIEGVTITRLIEDGPAEKSGELKDEDRIVAVDGESIVDYSFERVLDLIRGEGGSPVVLGIKRTVKEDGAIGSEAFDVTLVRAQIEIMEDRVDHSFQPFGDGIIGTITLHSFYDGENGVSSVRDVRNAIRQLKKEGDLKGLVFDMRQNTGGFLMQAVKVAGLFISNGVVVVSKYGDGQMRYFRDIDGHSYYDGPLVVLTSKGSASAAEIVAQALQDYGAGLVVGDERTYGKGSIQHQTVTDTNSSSYFKVTVGRYYTVSGSSTQIQGVLADVVVPTSLNQEKMGERFLDYPLEHDSIPDSYQDSLADLESEARRWYQRYYSPSLQPKVYRWRAMLPKLRENSQYRLENNKNFQEFMESIGIEVASDEDEEESDLLVLDDEVKGKKDSYGVADLQLTESINIIKDMILMNSTAAVGKLEASIATGKK